MKNLFKFSISLCIGLWVCNFAYAQVSNSLWTLSSGNVKPVISGWGLQVPSLAAGGNPCVTVTGTGLFSTQACSGGGGGNTFGFPFTATTNFNAGTNATTGILWFKNGIQSSSTAQFSDIATPHENISSVKDISNNSTALDIIPTLGATTFGIRFQGYYTDGIRADGIASSTDSSLSNFFFFEDNTEFSPQVSGKSYWSFATAPQLDGASNVSQFYGHSSEPFTRGSGNTYSGTAGDVAAYKGIAGWGSGTANNLTLFRGTVAGIGTVGNLYGLYLDNISGATSTNDAIKTGTGLIDFGDRLLVRGASTTLQNFTAQNSTTTSATSTNIATTNLKVGSATGALVTTGGYASTVTLNQYDLLTGNGSGGLTTIQANSPNGWLQLDANGNVNATLLPRLSTSTDIATIVLQEGELAYATDTRKFFIGDGTTAGGTPINPWNYGMSTARLGYGTTSPMATVAIQGDNTATSSFAVYGGTLSYAKGPSIVIKGGQGGFTGAAAAQQGGDVFITSGDAGQSGSSPSNAGTVWIGGGKPRAVLGAGTSYVALQVDPSGNALGSVGVGTSTPGTTFAVQGGGYIGSNLFVGGTITSTTTLASTIPYASTTMLSGTIASTTNLTVSSAGGSVQCLHSSAIGVITGTGSDCGSGGSNSFAFPWTATTNFNQTANATTTQIWLQGTPTALSASSTIQFVNASSTGELTLLQAGTGAVILGDVSGNARGSAALDIQSSSHGSVAVASGASSMAFGIGNRATASQAESFGNGNQSTGANSLTLGHAVIASGSGSSAIGTSITNNVDTSLMIGPSGNAAMTILGAAGTVGYVGIGTTTPYAQLSVTNTSSGPSFSVEDSASPDATQFNIDASGNTCVGCDGTSAGNPAHFSVIGQNSTAVVASFRAGSDNNADIQFCGNGCGYIGYSSTIAGFTLGGTTDGNGAAYPTIMIKNSAFLGDANVGIGLNSPAAKLDILGVYANTSHTLFKVASSTASDGSTSNPIFSVLDTGNVGIGTSSPFASFSVKSGSATNMLESVGTTSTSVIPNGLRYTDAYGHQYSGGDPVSVTTGGSGCGNSPLIYTGSNDSDGRIKIGTGISQTTCAISFSHAWVTTSNPPMCWANEEGGGTLGIEATTTSTTVIFTGTANILGQTFSYHCRGF